ncbi:hypothetical protein [Sphingomonas sp. UYEF23]|uniref:hypothetical protein n=1 Tax=unclassified Sphingomonas TaxID=196159 RepID=UPI003397516E
MRESVRKTIMIARWAVAIVSFEPNFIFIKTRKTAGTSLEVHLAEACGPTAIVTPIYPANPLHAPRNWTHYYNHMPAREIRVAQPERFVSAYKFAFERHPVDKSLSYYAMLRHSPHHYSATGPQSWRDYVDQGEFPVDDGLYTDDDGTLIVDRLYRYEELDQSLIDISDRTGLRHRPLTAREKTGFRRDDIPSFAEVMADAAIRNRILQAFASTLSHIAY